MKEEVFKDIPYYEGVYQVSNLGNVISLNYRGTNKRMVRKLTKGSSGYLTVKLSINNIKKTKRVHQLVAICFLNHKPRKSNIVVDHINNDKLDNRLENLQIITYRENSSKNKLGSSKYTGVSWYKKSKKWVAKIHKNGKLKHLGYFNSEYDAHLTYQKALKEHLKPI